MSVLGNSSLLHLPCAPAVCRAVSWCGLTPCEGRSNRLSSGGGYTIPTSTVCPRLSSRPMRSNTVLCASSVTWRICRTPLECHQSYGGASSSTRCSRNSTQYRCI